MKVTVVHVEDCPHTAPLLARLGVVLGPCTAVFTRAVSTLAEAAALGMHGSPTLLIEGRDPFDRSPEVSLSCRLYQTEDGLRGLPSIAQLHAAFTGHDARTLRAES